MRVSHVLTSVFHDANPVSAAGLVPVLELAEQAGLRKGNTRSGDSAEWYASRALATIGRIVPSRQVLARADSAFCTHAHVAAVTDVGVWCSFTIPQWPTVHAAIAIPDEDWTAIEYPEAIWDGQVGGWVSDAEVAETSFTAFTSHRKDEQVYCRLVVRRVKRLNGHAKNGQDTLFDTHRHHAFITNSTLDTVEADRRHRARRWHGHRPDGAHPHPNHPGARTRLATRTRHLIAHLPTKWPYATAWMRLWNTALGLDRSACLRYSADRDHDQTDDRRGDGIA